MSGRGRRGAALALLASAGLAFGWSAFAQEDVVARARALATSGQKTEALELLQGRLAAVPADSDARTLLGMVLSWEGRYDEARAELGRVIATLPGHGDALAALANVELWSGNPGRALLRAREGLSARGESASLRLIEAKALHAQASDSEALRSLDRILSAEPRNAEALALRETILQSRRRFTLTLDQGSDWFDDGRAAWHETSLQLKRDAGRGSLIARYAEARRFGESDRIFELESYPRLRPGSYAFVGVGFAPAERLYPAYRLALDVYQNLPRAFEVSLGYRRLGFDAPVNVYTGSLGLYRGSWYGSVRGFLAPSAPGASVSLHLSARRYLGGDREYVGLRYGHGRSREELRTLDDVALLGSDTLGFDWNAPVGRRLELLLRLGGSREERAAREELRRLSAQATLGYRF